MKKEYKRLKLNKFVGGKAQRIFKTTTSIVTYGEQSEISPLNTELDYNLLSDLMYDNCKLNEKNIFFSEYTEKKKPNVSGIIISGDLINFHDIHNDYYINSPNYKEQPNNLNSISSPWFADKAKQNERNKTKNKDERIIYFPEYINTPIDLTYTSNANDNTSNVSFLLPISTEKYINIAQSDILLNCTNYYNKEHIYKNNYFNTLSSQIFHGAYTSEDNSIPIYNLNYSNLESIYLKNHENVDTFINKYKLFDIQKDKLVINNETLDTNNYNSILLKPLIEYMHNNPSRFNNNLQREIINYLIESMTEYSFNKILTIDGYITKINENVISAFTSDNILSSVFGRENITNISGLFKEKQEYATSSTYIPQNALLNIEIDKALHFNEKTYSRQNEPSAYYKILYLKNNRNPHYNINCSDLSTAFIDYTIEIDNYKENPITITPNNLNFDIDITYTKELNGANAINGILNRYKTQMLLNEAKSLDLAIRQKINDTNIDIKTAAENYNFNFPIPLSNKINDYLLPYENLHIINNNIQDMGELHGIRNYIHIGSFNNNENLWFSYKYKTITDVDMIHYSISHYDYSNTKYLINIKEVRKNSWDLYKKFEGLITNNIMKYANAECPWGALVQQMMGCNCPVSGSCQGFCTFPINGKLEDTPQGISSTSSIIIKNTNNNVNLITETDCTVYDDIEIYFIDKNDPNAEKYISDITGNLLNITTRLSALFQGCGGYIHNKRLENFDYMAINNCITGNFGEHLLYDYKISKYTPFNISHTIKAGTILSGLNLTTNKYTDILSAGASAIIKPVSWWSNTVGFQGKIKTKFLDNEKNNLFTDVLNIVSKYDYIECNKGNFKFRQNELHKSNIYSIKLLNSGLNPENDLTTKYYTKEQLINKLSVSGMPTYENEYTGNGTNFNAIYDQETEMFEIDSSENIAKWTNISQSKYQRSFDSLCEEFGWVEDENKYYNSNVENTNIIRKSMRSLVEDAIRNSVSKYLPIDTTLWKIIYEGK